MRITTGEIHCNNCIISFDNTDKAEIIHIHQGAVDIIIAVCDIYELREALDEACRQRAGMTSWEYHDTDGNGVDR